MTHSSPASTPYFDAALRWFTGNDAVTQARALVDGREIEATLWARFAAFGVSDMVALEDSAEERACMVAEVGRAAGRALYTGPLARAPQGYASGAAHADGSIAGWQDSLAPGWSRDPADDRDLALLATCARLQGVGERVIELTLEQLGTRRQFGRALASFQALQHATVDRHCDLTVTGALLEQIVRQWRRADSHASTLHALKATAGPAALAACDHAVQMFGAMGFTHDCDVGLYLRHALVLAARHGTTAAHRSCYAARRIDFLGA